MTPFSLTSHVKESLFSAGACGLSGAAFGQFAGPTLCAYGVATTHGAASAISGLALAQFALVKEMQYRIAGMSGAITTRTAKALISRAERMLLLDINNKDSLKTKKEAVEKALKDKTGLENAVKELRKEGVFPCGPELLLMVPWGVAVLAPFYYAYRYLFISAVAKTSLIHIGILFNGLSYFIADGIRYKLTGNSMFGWDKVKA